jgi:hypothetical protein
MGFEIDDARGSLASGDQPLSDTALEAWSARVMV